MEPGGHSSRYLTCRRNPRKQLLNPPYRMAEKKNRLSIAEAVLFISSVCVAAALPNYFACRYRRTMRIPPSTNSAVYGASPSVKKSPTITPSRIPVIRCSSSFIFLTSFTIRLGPFTGPLFGLPSPTTLRVVEKHSLKWWGIELPA